MYECNQIAEQNDCRVTFLEKEGTCLLYDCQKPKNYCESGCVYGFSDKNWVCAPRDVCYENDPGSGGFIGTIVGIIVYPFRLLYSLLLQKEIDSQEQLSEGLNSYDYQAEKQTLRPYSKQ